MQDKQGKTSAINDKLSCVNTSINLMTDCVKYLEKIRSYNYLAYVDEQELQQVLSHLQSIEKSIDRIKPPTTQESEHKNLIRAVGTHGTMWVTKPTNTTDKPNRVRFSPS